MNILLRKQCGFQVIYDFGKKHLNGRGLDTFALALGKLRFFHVTSSIYTLSRFRSSQGISIDGSLFNVGIYM